MDSGEQVEDVKQSPKGTVVFGNFHRVNSQILEILTVFGKAYIVVIRAISRVTFPDTTSDSDDYTVEPVSLFSLLGTGGAAMGILLSDFWVVTLFGQAYSPVIEFLPRYMLMMLPYPAIALVGIHSFGSGTLKDGIILFSMVLILYLSTVAASTLSHLI